MLAAALGAVLERHLDRASPAEIGLWSMRGLEVIEPALRTELQANTLLLSARDPAGPRLLAARPVPPAAPDLAPDSAARPLAVSLSAMFDAAWRASPTLRRAGPDRMLRSAFEELFNHLDPYSRYLSPEEALAARARRAGESGLGLRLAAGRREEVRIATIAPGGPAAQAGLRVGDRLVAVEGTPVTADDLAGAASLLEGPEDTPVNLRIDRGRRRLEVTLRRAQPPAETVRAETRDGILVLRISAFAAVTELRVADALADAFRRGAPRGIVLDLRGNRGGVLGQAAAVAGAFLEAGDVVARTAGRHPEAGRSYVATGPDQARGRPIVVLVDGRTASAAEIVAAALADQARAVVVGSATTGKGLIQAVLPLPNGGELFVSWARILAPAGWPIQALGVLPALCTARGAEAMAEGLARLRTDDPPMARLLARQRALRAPVPPETVAALRAACPPAEGRDLDLAAARALIEQPEAWEAALAP